MSKGDAPADAGYDLTLLRLIERIYAAATGEATWDEVVVDVRRAGHLDGVGIVARDRQRPGPGTMLAAAGLGRCRSTGHALGGQPANPLLTDAVLRSKPGAVWLDHEIMPAALWAHTAFRDRWMHAQGFVGWACVIIATAADECVYLETYASTPRSPLGHQALTLLSRLAPHLIRAWRIAGGTASLAGRAETRSAHQSGPAAALPPDAELRRVFGLTRAEARLAMHLASGQSLATAADAFGVRMTTLRSQLGQVYSKTGTGRQCELVSLILRRDLVGEAVRRASERLSA